MSWPAMTWALSQKLKAPEKLVLLLLAYRTNPDSETADPTIDTMATECGMSRSGLKIVIQRLVEKSLIGIEIRRRPDGMNHPNLYRLNFSAGGHDVTPGGAGRDRKGGHDVTTKAGSNTDKGNNAGAKLDLSSWPEAPSTEHLEAWLALRKQKRALTSELAIKRMGKELHAAAAKGWTVDQALEECVHRGWQGLNAEWLDEKTQPGRAGLGKTTTGSGHHAASGRKGNAGPGSSAIDRVLGNARRRAEAPAEDDSAGSDRGGSHFDLRP